MKSTLDTHDRLDLSIPLRSLNHVHPLLFFLTFFSIFLYHTRHEIPIYQRKFHKRKIFLYLHIITGTSDLFRYRFNEFLYGPFDALPDALGVLSSLIWAFTSLELVKTLRRGDPRTTRPPYQAGAILRPLVSLTSYLFGLPALHRLSISALDSFIYARLAIFFFCHTPYIRSYSRSKIYAISIPLSAALAIHESRVPGASILYLLAVSYVTRLNEWVTYESRSLRCKDPSRTVSPYWKSMISVFIEMGFFEIEELKEVSKARELENVVVDQYVPKLSLDMVG
ncbi:hypothetical protein N7493_007563 [Penicillium malachiteum]|uniref:Uncharacterized protein n=1 Tax=Penicillium malachiteum TaxID=1324776 RepID=A0AAD6MU30_9EURO|nr:hypothetical protein N7493_007563 [Penicillium malachiteum]